MNEYLYTGEFSMKITSQILSIPPYISTSWRNIASLHVESQETSLVLIVTLLNGTRIEIPYLQAPMIETIFAAHARFLEQDQKPVPSKALPKNPFNFSLGNEQVLALELPFKNSLADSEGFGTLLQHNPQQADSPDLPTEVLEKITQIVKSIGIDDPNVLPKAEPHCNCMRCQIARAMQAGANGDETGNHNKEESLEEVVSDEDLKFKTWDVVQTDDNLYIVTNPLDEKEHYNVYLGEPIGCTCGENHCEHIRAVLHT
jgi:hypothetical protein